MLRKKKNSYICSFLHCKRQQINSALFVMEACNPKQIE